MKLTFLGAAQTVTGSKYLVEHRDRRILVDCGLFQGRRAESRERNQRFPFDPSEVTALLLSHAHIDHSGALPSLVKGGWKGTVHLTEPTAELAELAG